MIKECKVILRNSAVMVVDFGGTKVQFPTTKTNGEVVYVEYIDGKYSIVSKEDYEKSLKPKANKKTKNIEINPVKDGEEYNSEL